MYISKRYIWIFVFVTGGLFGWLSIVALTNHAAYRVTQNILANNSTTEKRVSRGLLQRHTLWYGIVESVENTRRTITVRFTNQFVLGNTILLEIVADDQTIFVEQNMIREDGVYTGFSEKVSGSIANILPGMRISALLENLGNSGILPYVRAAVIVFGSQTL
jgi:hypothetical protein